jgi:hypothetical protein
MWRFFTYVVALKESRTVMRAVMGQVRGPVALTMDAFARLHKRIISLSGHETLSKFRRYSHRHNVFGLSHKLPARV